MWSSLSGLRRSQLVMLTVFSALLFCFILAPFTLPAGSVTDLSGTVGGVENLDQIEEMNPFAYSIYLFGDANCHQIAERSYYLNGNVLPVCARDLGIFTGLVVGMALLFATQYRPRFYMIILLVLPMAIDGGVQAVTDYVSNNPLRFATGSLAGAGGAFFLTYLARELLGGTHDRTKSVE
ncbi:MAG TPA: DUF2085 domain-containing protein [Methanomassiliicoccales archaeon]|nr:DUF2085 domain-containing protein [Methanomassiliicoccales archaeon]